MSEKAAKPKDRVKLDVQTILHTTEGRPFINQLNTVSHVLTMKDSEVEFKGELLAKTGYVSDCKSAQLFRCPNGYFLFCDKAFTNNNWSAIGQSINEVLSKLDDADIKNKLQELVPAEAV